jgi:hypothetical protein
MISGEAVARGGRSTAVGAVPADAPPVSDKDMPTTPATGTASLRRLGFEVRVGCAMVETSCSFELGDSRPRASRTFCQAISTPDLIMNWTLKKLTYLSETHCHVIVHSAASEAR